MTADSTLIAAAKKAGRITTNEFDSEVERLLNASFLDMGVAGVVAENADPLIEQAAITYFLLHFGEPDNYDRLERSYNEQKAQLATHTGHTVWTVNNG